VREDLLGLYLLAIASVFAARAIRSWVEGRRRTLVAIGYPQRTVRCREDGQCSRPAAVITCRMSRCAAAAHAVRLVGFA